jgi:protein-S-isoprenylcysteine O-methyltransferase Ste14
MELASGSVDTASTETAAEPPAYTRVDVPTITAPAPWIAFGALALGLAFDASHLFKVMGYVPLSVRGAVALVLIAAGGWCILRANVIFHRAETPFQSWRPARAIAAQDIYARTRNPMHQGFLLMVFGLAVLLRSDWTILFLLPAATLIHFGVVMREENYLERRFGDSYRQYKAAVPRYGWPFKIFRAR